MNKPTSLYLDLVRFLAAATIFAGHANYDRFTGGLPILWRLQDLGNDAVMVFFVLSGFVIAYVSDQKEKSLKEYLISRLARLYSVVAPALILTVVLDYIGSRVSFAIYNGWWFQTDNPVWRFLANLFFGNELWFWSVRAFSNGPFWSLGYEFWYYVIFASAFYLKPTFRYLFVGAFCLLVGPKILMLFPIWLLGVWVYFKVKNDPVSQRVGWLMFLGSAGAYVVFRQLGYPGLLLDWTVARFGSTFVHEKLAWSQYFLSSYVIGVLVALHFVGLAAVSRRIGRFLGPCETPIRYLAGYTFAIYLFHYPLLQFFAALSALVADQYLRTAIVVIGTIGAVWAAGTITERRKGDLRRLLLYGYDTLARARKKSIAIKG